MAEMSLTAACAEFISACRADGLRPASLKWYTSLLNAFAAKHKGVQLDQMTATTLRQYIIALRERQHRYIAAPQKPVQKGGLSDSSINGHVTALHAFWAWAAREYSIANPMLNIKRPKRQQPQPRAIAPRDFVKMFDCADNDRDRALLAFLADSGCRLGGLVGLEIEHINMINRRATVTEKGKKTRSVVFTGYTRVLLLYCIAERKSGAVFVSSTSGDGLTVSGVAQLLKRLKQRAGVTGRVNPHSFRHRFAIAYLENGGDPMSLAKLMGDDIQTVFNFYANFMPDELDVLHEKFSPFKAMLRKNRPTTADTS